MTSSRQDRFASLLKELISEILLKELNDSRVGFVSLMDIVVSTDLKHAKVYYSCFGSEKQKKDTRIGLEKAQSFIRSLIASRINTRNAPEIKFIEDDSLEKGDKVLRKLKELENAEKNTPKN